MSARCVACGHLNADFTSVCAECGVALRGNASNITPLAALMPEAEPPLPTAHEVLRTRPTERKDPTPGRVPPERVPPERRDPTPGREAATAIGRRDPTPGRVPLERRDPTPGRVVAEIAPSSAMADAPGPLEDPSAWFDDNTPDSARRLTPSGKPGLTPMPQPRGTGGTVVPDPSLVATGSFWRRALMAVTICLVIGALVGWVLSR